MKRLLATTALIALLGAPAMAASSEDAAGNAAAVETPRESSATAPTVTGEELSLNDFIGETVYSSAPSAEGESPAAIGEIADALFAPGGEIRSVLVDVGGFLGVGEKRVAMDIDALDIARDQNGDLMVSTALTEEQLKAAPIYNAEATVNRSLSAQSQADPEAVKKKLDDAAAAAPTGSATTTGSVTTTAPAMGEDAADDYAAAPEAVQPDEGASSAPAITPAPPQTADRQSTDPATEETVEADPLAAPTPLSEEEANELAAADGALESGSEAVWTEVEAASVSAERLEGADVYDVNEEVVGEIDRLVGVDGETQAVIDIGGFLGFGAKPVLTPLAELRVMQSPDGDEVKVHIARTGDDLSKAPAFKG